MVLFDQPPKHLPHTTSRYFLATKKQRLLRPLTETAYMYVSVFLRIITGAHELRWADQACAFDDWSETKLFRSSIVSDQRLRFAARTLFFVDLFFCRLQVVADTWHRVVTAQPDNLR